MNNNVLKHWDSWSGEYYAKNDTQEVIERIIHDPTCAFPRKTFELIQKHVGDLHGKSVCVPASGDNTAVFAFHLLGARVTSTDISSEQIKNAQMIAAKNGWDITFICEDNMDFRKVKSGEYDLVYTSNGVGVWISDLEAMYKNFHRVLKDKGHYIMFDTHPFDRPFDSNQETITVIKRYDAIGPIDEIPTYHWRIEDYLNALISAGFHLKAVKELHSEVGSLGNHNWWYTTCEEAEKDHHRKHDWRQNPWAALPQWLSICVQKAVG